MPSRPTGETSSSPHQPLSRPSLLRAAVAFLALLAILQAAASICLTRNISSDDGDGRAAAEDASLRFDVNVLRSEVGALRKRLDELEEGEADAEAKSNSVPTGVERNVSVPLSNPRSPVPPIVSAVNATAILDGPPKPFDSSSTSRLWLRQYARPYDIDIWGVKIKYVVRKAHHMQLIRDHVHREMDGYAILKGAIARAKERNPGEVPLVLDVGSNHGMYALFAAKLGADVVALEPQMQLCRLISEAARLNGGDVAGRITVFHSAALDVREVVNLQGTNEDGGVATVARTASGVSKGESVAARPVADFIPISERREVCFLKVDVEGFELRAMKSAGKDLLGRVRNLLVEYGPPSRWVVANNTAEDGEELLQRMANEEGFESRLIKSFVWDWQTSKKREEMANYQKQRFKPLTGPDQKEIVKSMKNCSCEGYIWFTRDKDANLGIPATGNGH
mmetsp:Transcript_146/g.302  ORF Transcript_146/g.302 Transcript_146/m.302 type:complete len:451 (-) Transcript_146:258-1610(-)